MITIKKAQIQEQEDKHQYSATLKVQLIINEETTITVSEQDTTHVNGLKTLSEAEQLETDTPFSE